MPAYLTPQDVARKLQVSRLTVYRWATSGLLPSFKMGRAVRFEPDAVETFIAHQAHASVEPGPDPERLAIFAQVGRLLAQGIAASRIQACLQSLAEGEANPQQEPAAPAPDPEELVMRAYRDAVQSLGSRRVTLLALRAHCPIELEQLGELLARLQDQQRLKLLGWTSHERLSLDEHSAGLEIDGVMVYWVKDGDRIWLRELGSSDEGEDLEEPGNTAGPDV